MTDDHQRPKRHFLAATDAATIGIEIAVSVTLGAVGGYYLERHVTHWSPWTMLIGLALGIGAAANAVIRTARGYQRRIAEQSQDRDDD